MLHALGECGDGLSSWRTSPLAIQVSFLVATLMSLNDRQVMQIDLFLTSIDINSPSIDRLCWSEKSSCQDS